MNVNEQKKILLEKLGSGGNTKIGYSGRTISMNINRNNRKSQVQDTGNKGCKNCSRKSGRS